MHCGRDFDPINPTEDRYFGIDFVNDIPEGSTISTASSVLTVKIGADTSPSSHLSGAAVVVGTEVRQRIKNCVAGNVYTLSIDATDSNGNIVPLNAHIPCVAVY